MLPPRPWLMLVTEPTAQLSEIVAIAVAGGVNVVQWRSSVAEIAPLGDELYAACGGRVPLVRNGPAVGMRQRLDGVQLPEGEIADARRLRAMCECFVGRSVHSVERAVWAAEDGADYLVAGTIYPSNSHPGEPGQGVGFLREVCAAVAPLPVIAIGGITPERVGECIAAGAAGVAVLSPIMRADDPQAVARTYREALDTAWERRNE